MATQGKSNRTFACYIALAAGMLFLSILVGCAVVKESQAGNALSDGGAPTEWQSREQVTDNSAPYEFLAQGIDAGTVAESDMYWDGEEPQGAPDRYNTEEYGRIREGGFTDVAVRPLSTLSADVDTASYCNLRRMINDGFTVDDIPAGAVRIEEMLNYFTYDYAAPEGDSLFGTTVQVADCPWNPKAKLMVMGFNTKNEPSATAGSNLVFLIDVSGSMDSYDKLDLLQDSFETLVDGLSEDDRVSIVTYASGEELVLDGARGSEKRKIMRAVDRLRADGSTNGEAGLKMAYEVAKRNFIEGGVNRIVLASDGDLNVGMTDESSLEAYVSKQRDTGVYLSVLGFGSGNYKDNKMEVLADNGNGSYHYIDCIEEAERVFGRNLTANLVPLADDVKLQVEFNPAMVGSYRLVGYENRALEEGDFRNDAKDAGEVGPGHQFTVAYEIVLAQEDRGAERTELKYGTVRSASVANAAAGGEAVEGEEGGADDAGNAADGVEEKGEDVSSEWLTCTMRYRPAGQGEAREQSFVVDVSAYAEEPSDDWRFAAAVIEAGMVMRNSEYANGATIDDVRGLLREGQSDLERVEFAELMKSLEDGWSKREEIDPW